MNKPPYQLGRESMYDAIYKIIDDSLTMYQDLHRETIEWEERDCLEAVVFALTNIKKDVEELNKRVIYVQKPM